jgi:hypothetical protein
LVQVVRVALMLMEVLADLRLFKDLAQPYSRWLVVAAVLSVKLVALAAH